MSLHFTKDNSRNSREKLQKEATPFLQEILVSMVKTVETGTKSTVDLLNLFQCKSY